MAAWCPIEARERVDMAGDLRVVAFLHALPGQEEAVLAAAQACIGPTRAEAGNDSYVLTRDGKDSSMFVFVEHWKSQAAVDEHMQSCASAGVRGGFGRQAARRAGHTGAGSGLGWFRGR